MKKTFLLFISALFMLSLVNTTNANKAAKEKFVKVVYFHGDYRCQTCNRIESLIKKTMKQHFSNEISKGTVVFEIINYDKDNNEHFKKDYDLYNQSLIISKFKSSTEKDWKNCQKIWELNTNSDKFIKYVKKETNNYLSEL